MKNKRIFLSAFIKQSDENDCGFACLQMIFFLAGKDQKAKGMRDDVQFNKSGLTLAQLKDVAINNGVAAKSVVMEMSYLRDLKFPCILHMVNNDGQYHYQVCFGMQKKYDGYYYLMADPAKQIYLLAEKDLADKWDSKAALYFEPFSINSRKFSKPAWLMFLEMNFYPRILWVAIPLLNIIAGVLGIAISWVLQSWSGNSDAAGKDELIYAVIGLLLVVTLFKNVINFIKLHLINIAGNAIHEKLVMSYARDLIHGSVKRKRSMSDKALQIAMTEILKIQNASTLFISVMLSEGSIVVLLISGIFYIFPVIAYLNLGFITLSILLTVIKLPSLAADFSAVKENFVKSEQLMNKELEAAYDDQLSFSQMARFASYQHSYRRYLSTAKTLVNKTSKRNLLYECMGTTDTVSALGIAMFQFQKDSIDYKSVLILVIASYLIAVLMPKICDAVYFINEGAKSFRQFSRTISI